jgi:hypothetical protein
VFVDGQYMYGGAGANIFKYLTVGDSYANHDVDAITNFDPVKDVIDLSSIDANTGLYSAAPMANFTFIGMAPLSGPGGQVRFQYDPRSTKPGGSGCRRRLERGPGNSPYWRRRPIRPTGRPSTFPALASASGPNIPIRLSSARVIRRSRRFTRAPTRTPLTT